MESASSWEDLVSEALASVAEAPAEAPALLLHAAEALSEQISALENEIPVLVGDTRETSYGVIAAGALDLRLREARKAAVGGLLVGAALEELGSDEQAYQEVLPIMGMVTDVLAEGGVVGALIEEQIGSRAAWLSEEKITKVELLEAETISKIGESVRSQDYGGAAERLALAMGLQRCPHGCWSESYTCFGQHPPCLKL